MPILGSMSIPPGPGRGQKIWLAVGRFKGYWTLGVVAVVLAAILVLLVLHFTGVIHLEDS